MPSPIKISIDAPCGEDFRQFTATEQGGFCQSCQKEVIDFTSMSDRAVYNYFQQAEGNVCGRLRKDQMKVYQAMLPVSPVDPPKTKWYLALAASLGLLALVQPNEVKSQVWPLTPKPPVVQVDIPVLERKEVKGEKQISIVSGQVIDRNGSILIGATVYAKELKKEVVTNMHGEFRIEIPVLLTGKLTLQTSQVGYKSSLEILKLSRKNYVFNITLEYARPVWAAHVPTPSIRMLGGITSTKIPEMEECEVSAIQTTKLKMIDGIWKRVRCYFN